MKRILKLVEEVLNLIEGLYPTNKKEEVKSKIDDDSEDITTSDTQYYLQFMKLFTMEMHLMIAI